MTSRTTGLVVALLVIAGCAAVPPPRPSRYRPGTPALGVTRIAHAGLLVAMGETLIAIDPWFHSGVFVRQNEPLGILPRDVPPLAATLVTATSSDHLDTKTLRELAPRTGVAIGPPAAVRTLTAAGVPEVRGLAPGEETIVGTTTIRAVGNGRGRIVGWRLEAAGTRVWVGTADRPTDDTLAILADSAPVDVALLPISGRRVLGIQTEASPEDAARAAIALDAERLVPIGYAAHGLPPFWWYPARRLPRLRDAMQSAERPGRVVVLEPGESWHRDPGR